MDFECRIRGAEYLAYPPVVAGWILLTYAVRTVVNLYLQTFEFGNIEFNFKFFVGLKIVGLFAEH